MRNSSNEELKEKKMKGKGKKSWEAKHRSKKQEGILIGPPASEGRKLGVKKEERELQKCVRRKDCAAENAREGASGEKGHGKESR